ncbi:MAG: hypothetical protein Solivirus1_60 [Solivirus sp.]|uniref:Uncharacterized protein n=1 Tax=Solivirus sp. TaxID=2487772 RepID=A0A3G5AJB5_9VIRU|nr:MAG: hypothetical protein Solivirus1_60 [Solivirus sp.]
MEELLRSSVYLSYEILSQLDDEELEIIENSKEYKDIFTSVGTNAIYKLKFDKLPINRDEKRQIEGLQNRTKTSWKTIYNIVNSLLEGMRDGIEIKAIKADDSIPFEIMSILKVPLNLVPVDKQYIYPVIRFCLTQGSVGVLQYLLNSEQITIYDIRTEYAFIFNQKMIYTKLFKTIKFLIENKVIIPDTVFLMEIRYKYNNEDGNKLIKYLLELGIPKFTTADYWRAYHVKYNVDPNDPYEPAVDSSLAPRSYDKANQCQAITKIGTQCKRDAKIGHIYCRQHENMN